MKTKFVAPAIVLIFCFMYTMVVTARIIAADYSLYLSESKCVQENIVLGIPRASIVTNNGTCVVSKENK